jgi:DNA-binding PadR family transcriptional regulator
MRTCIVVPGGLLTGKPDVWQGTLALMVLKTLERTRLDAWLRIARQIEQTSADRLSVNYGTLYPALLKLEQEGYIHFRMGSLRQQSESEVLSLTRAGRKQIAKETQEWEQTTAILSRFLKPRIA